MTWSQGDFDYNGVVGSTDIEHLFSHFGSSPTGLPPKVAGSIGSVPANDLEQRAVRRRFQRARHGRRHGQLRPRPVRHYRDHRVGRRLLPLPRRLHGHRQ